MSVFTAVPVKDLTNAKQRLVPVLSGMERRKLTQAMLEDVLLALSGTLDLSVHVVSTDGDVLSMARRHGVACLVESANRGHTEAVAFAQHAARASGADRFLTIPGDVPCVTAAEVVAVLRALPDDRSALFVPSLSGFGTNAALLAPPDVMPLKFGEPSFDNHLEAARQRGLAPVVLSLPGLGLDIDAPEDLSLLLARGPETRSATLLREWGLSGRLADRS
jgi:2-phospho-L-lactate guanylyltransferase